MACHCPYGAILGVLQGNSCSFVHFKTDDLVRVASMYVVKDRDAHILRCVHKCDCGVWERGSDLVCCVSQIYILSPLENK